MKRILTVLLLLFLKIGSLTAQTTPVAGWGVMFEGQDRGHLNFIDGNAFASLTIQNERIILSLVETKTLKSLFSILLHNLYLTPSAEEGKSFIGMKSKFTLLDGTNKINGVLNINIAENENEYDILHFDFGRKDLYIVGFLLEGDEMFPKLAKLASLGVGLEKGAKLKRPLSKIIEEY
ncbi:MAG: hypothetical protein HDR88_14580 [Bacteroides sp.]|nr:hypothetical protein [Bacteroides sp.]